MNPEDIIGNIEDAFEIALEVGEVKLDGETIKSLLEQGDKETLQKLKQVIARTKIKENKKILFDVLTKLGDKYAKEAVEYAEEEAKTKKTFKDIYYLGKRLIGLNLPEAQEKGIELFDMAIEKGTYKDAFKVMETLIEHGKEPTKKTKEKTEKEGTFEEFYDLGKKILETKKPQAEEQAITLFDMAVEKGSHTDAFKVWELLMSKNKKEHANKYFYKGLDRAKKQDENLENTVAEFIAEKMKKFKEEVDEIVKDYDKQGVKKYYQQSAIKLLNKDQVKEAKELLDKLAEEVEKYDDARKIYMHLLRYHLIKRKIGKYVELETQIQHGFSEPRTIFLDVHVYDEEGIKRLKEIIEACAIRDYITPLGKYFVYPDQEAKWKLQNVISEANAELKEIQEGKQKGPPRPIEIELSNGKVLWFENANALDFAAKYEYGKTVRVHIFPDRRKTRPAIKSILNEYNENKIKDDKPFFLDEYKNYVTRAAR